MDLRRKLAFLGVDLLNAILEKSKIQSFEAGTQILKVGQHVNVLPILIDGLIKVSASYTERDLLLYYIQPVESCIMSFTAGMHQQTSKVYAIAEEESTVLLLPTRELPALLRQYPRFNDLFFQQFNERYTELLETIHHLLFQKMDQRLYDYLLEKKALTKRNPLQLSHRQIAADLGTVREVISRVMKKLETEGKVKQLSNSIKIIEW